jgi:phosphatidylserine/phosphatidylglycerophosphate/cardiolipin synthase-like enzyme
MLKNRLLIITLCILILLTPACQGNVNLPGETITPLSSPATDTPPSNTGGQVESIPLKVGFGAKSDWYEVYFTDPTNSFSAQLSGGVDGPLVDAINAARQSVDVAAYSLSLNSVRYALINAFRRGVDVRVVMESENMDRTDPQKLISAGIPVIGDRRDGLMHDKFIVIDRSEVWTGSMNYTDSGAYGDNNNLMRIRSTKIAENYTREFEEMFKEDLFGPDIKAQTPNPQVTIDDVNVENYFSPDDGVAQHISDLLNGANKSIYFMAYSFTNDEFGQIIMDKAKTDVVIKGVMEEEQVNSNQGTQYDPFKQAGLDVRIDGNPGLMHHKVFIIDGNTVILGSYNFSFNAENRNDENVIIIHDEQVARLYLEEFLRVYDIAR